MGLDLSNITADLQAVVRLSTAAADAIKKFELQEVTYNVVNSGGIVVGTFPPTEKPDEDRQRANDLAAELEESIPQFSPYAVESESVIEFDQDGDISLEGSTVGEIFPTEEIKAINLRIQNEINCANIEKMIEDELKTITDQITANTSELSNIMQLNTLTSIPSDPLKILSWVRKFVSKFIAPYLMTLIDIAIQLAQFAAAVADLQNTILATKENLIACAAAKQAEILNKTVGRVNEITNKIERERSKTILRIANIQDDLMRVTGKSQRWIAPEDLQGEIDEARIEQQKRFMERTLRLFAGAPFGSFVDLNVTGDGQAITTENGPAVFVAAGNTLFSNTDVNSDPNLAFDRAQFANSVSGELATDAAFSDSIGNTILSSNNKFASSVGDNIAANSTIRETFMTNLGAFSANVSIPGANSAPGQGVNGKFEIITARGTSDQVRYQVENGLIVNIKVGLP
jgi:hypothetical protein